MSSPRPVLPTSPTTSHPPSPSSSQDSWDFMLPGPPSRNNLGSADLSPSGLLAFPSGSSISVVDSRSLQLVTTIPMPPPNHQNNINNLLNNSNLLSSSSSSSSSQSLSPFVTSVRWTPLPLCRDLLTTEPSSSHLLLAAGDRQGRLALIDLRLRSPVLWFDSDPPKQGIQDICWVQARPDSYLLAAISGSSSLSLYNTLTGQCLFKYDAAPEYLSCIRRDPFDARHFCVMGLKGLLLSVKIHGEKEDDVVLKVLQIQNDSTELQKLERDANNANGTTSSSSESTPASATFPLYVARFAFSPQWRHIVFVTFPRELVVFDLQYDTALFTTSLPRGCGKFLEVLPDPNNELLYCAHLDGKLSTWRRKGGEQVHIMCSMEELMPSIGTPVPSPSVLAVIICQSDSMLDTLGKFYSDVPHSPYSNVDFDSPFDFNEESIDVSKTHLISISDDGKIWNWLLTVEGGDEDSQKDGTNLDIVPDVCEVPVPGTNSNIVVSSTGTLALETGRTKENKNGTRRNGRSNSLPGQADLSIKISLVGQLQLLSSTVTMLAVPSPSLTATLACGGNHPAVAVPLVALGTQNGTIEVIDVSANAVAASFSVHSCTVRGLRWLGNSRLVSFSYTEVNEKSGGYVNKLVVTCIRSGLNKSFRNMQKPERAPIRALRTSSSGRYLLILFRDAPVEVWAMTKNPILIRSLALPFTVLEWTLPTVPRPNQNIAGKQSSVASPATTASSDSKTLDGSQDDISESFAFALVNGALGVFEVHGRRIRDLRPKWPSSSFVSSDGLVTAMAYRLPHVVMGDRSGNIRWWDVITGHSSSFNTHREGIRRIKFSPVVPGDRSRGRVAVLFYDNTFSVFDLDSPDPLANSVLQPQLPGTLVLELDWLPLRTDKNDPLVLGIAGADSSFRLVEVTLTDKRLGSITQPRSIKERFRPMPLCSPILLPTPHALALRMILQLGVKPSWFNTCSTNIEKRPHLIPGVPSSSADLRSYLIDLPPVGDPVVPELLLKILEPYRKEGCLLDDERAKLYAKVVNKGCAARFAFSAAVFGETSEALFWLQLPRALSHLMKKKLITKPPTMDNLSTENPVVDNTSMLSRISSKGKSLPESGKRDALGQGSLRLMAFEREELCANASERIPWHEKLEGEEAVQNHVHELVSIGNLEAAVSLLLSTPPEGKYFYANALRAVALSSAVSRSLHELAVKVVAANMVRTDRSLFGTHLLCAVGRYQEACSQLQDAGCWTDAATLAATHLKGSDYTRVLLRWAEHILGVEHNTWRALSMYVAAGALQEALAALRQSQQPDTAAMFILACREIHFETISNVESADDDVSSSSFEDKQLNLPGLDPKNEDVIAVGEYYGQYQRKLVHLCMDSQPYSE